MRLVFKTVEEFLVWVKNNATSEKYTAYKTDYNEYILVPKKSTRPLIYVYYKYNDEAEDKAIQGVLGQLGIKLYLVKTIDWDETKGVGVRVTVEE